MCRVAAGAGGKAGSGLMVSFGAENGTGARTRLGLVLEQGPSLGKVLVFALRLEFCVGLEKMV